MERNELDQEHGKVKLRLANNQPPAYATEMNTPIKKKEFKKKTFGNLTVTSLDQTDPTTASENSVSKSKDNFQFLDLN